MRAARVARRELAALVISWTLSCAAVAATTAPTVRFLSPDGDEPAIGEVVVTTVMESEEPIAQVSLMVDGLFVGRRVAPPFSFPVALREENMGHSFEVSATTSSGDVVKAGLENPPIRVDEVIEVALRQVFVSVSDRTGRFVPDLEKEHFRLFDDGIRQQIVTFARGDIAFSAVLLLDGSESMRGPQIDAARAGAGAFLASMTDLDEAKVLVFSTRVLATSPFVGPGARLDDLISGFEPDGGSAIHDFTFLALRSLEQRISRRVLVLLSDGMDVHSVLDADQLAVAAKKSSAQIFWLRLEEVRRSAPRLVNSWRDPESSRQQLRRLEKIIEESGGEIISVAGPAETEPAFRKIVEKLRNQYALGYYPEPRFGNGRWRRLEVDVEGRFKVSTRRGYMDPAQ